MVRKLTFETRKIQKTVDGTCLVSLPKRWIKKFNLKKGSIVYVRERSDGCLILDPQQTTEFSPEITLKATGRIESKILSSYLLGYEIINLESPKITEDCLKRVKLMMDRLVGVELTEETPQKIVLQCLLKPTAYSPEKILRREYVLSMSMLKDLFSILLNSDAELAKSLTEKDDEIDRLYFLLVRILRTIILNPKLGEKLEISPMDCLDYRIAASLIENIADRVVLVAREINRTLPFKLPESCIAEIKNVGENIYFMYESAIKAFFSKNEKIHTEAIEKMYDVINSIKNLEKALEEETSIPSRLAYVLPFSFKGIAGGIRDLLDLVTTIPPAIVPT
ncbi:MAG: phosphate uptake regulator PhoU [Candidatus Bathyarchaeota archaeon]|nr:phosphate uptake regulator PhoU [Candidatus Bathyarchaeota archaeon]